MRSLLSESDRERVWRLDDGSTVIEWIDGTAPADDAVEVVWTTNRQAVWLSLVSGAIGAGLVEILHRVVNGG